MVKKQRIAKSIARTAPKSQEKYLIENAKKLQQNPFLILPTCTEGNERSFERLRKRLAKIQRYHTDEAKLEKLAKRSGLDGALAGTLLLALSEKAPYLAALSFPTGEITYAQRGKADKEKLIAVQHFDDPVFRLRGIKDIVFKKKLHVYSWDGGYVCTGQEAYPPSEFIDFIRKKIGFTSTNNVIHCLHVPAEIVKRKEFLSLNYLRIEWRPAQTIIALCENCAKVTKNTMFTISKYILEKNLTEEFDIEVMTQLGKHSVLSDTQKSTNLQKYLTGTFTDFDFIKQMAKSQQDQVKEADEKIFILDGVSYGTDAIRFIETLQPNTTERAALEYFLNKTQQPVIVSNITPSKLLERYWEQYGNEFLESILTDKKIAVSLFQLDDTPSNIIMLAFEYRQRRQILSQLPTYDTLPPLAAFADTVVRTYMTFGEKKAVMEIKKHPDTPKARAIAYAFLLALGKGTEVKWKYSKDEADYGEYLKDYANKFLHAKPEEYRTALQDLLIASGSSETIE